MRQLENLRSLNLSADARNSLLNIAAALNGDGSSSGGGGGGGNSEFEDPNSSDLTMGGKIIRIDVSKGAKHTVTFVNNLERDAMYSRWPRTLRQLLFPSWSLHTIARNLYTVVVVADPATYEGAALLMQMQMLLQQQYPIRFGITLACEEGGGE
jgi:Thioredoxin-like domain